MRGRKNQRMNELLTLSSLAARALLLSQGWLLINLVGRSLLILVVIAIA